MVPESKMKLRRLAVVSVGFLAAGLLLSAQPHHEVFSLLTEVDADIDRWHRLSRDSGDSERRDLKLGLGRRLDRFSNLFERGSRSLPTTPAGAGYKRSEVDKSIRTLDRAALVDPDDHELASSVASAYMAVARIQGHPSYPNLGYTRGSAATYAKATRILARVQRLAPEYARGRSLISQARSSVYAYSGYPWFRPEVFVLLDLGAQREPGTPPRGEPRGHDQPAASSAVGSLGELVDEILRAEGERILAAFGDEDHSAAGAGVREIRVRQWTVERKAEQIWLAAEDLHGRLSAEGGLRKEAVLYLARLEIFIAEAQAALDVPDAGRAKRNLVRAEFEISRLGKIVGVSP